MRKSRLSLVAGAGLATAVALPGCTIDASDTNADTRGNYYDYRNELLRDDAYKKLLERLKKEGRINCPGGYLGTKRLYGAAVCIPNGSCEETEIPAAFPNVDYAFSQSLKKWAMNCLSGLNNQDNQNKTNTSK